MRTAVVVGAGLSGLAAAYRLQQAGLAVTVLERDEGPGGRVQTVRHEGYLIDTGADAVSESYSRYLALLRDVGLGDRVVPASPVVGLVRDGAVIDIDPRRPLRMMTSPALSLAGKRDLLTGYLKVRRSLRDLDPYELGGSADRDDPAMTAHDFGRPQFGPEVTEKLIDPVARLVTGVGARHASHLNVLGALKSWTASLVNVRGGLNLLPSELAKQLDIQYGARVTRVQDTAAGVEVSYTDRAGRSLTVDADGCVIAAMYDVAAGIWPTLTECAPDFGAHLRYLSLISVSVGYPALTSSDAYVVLVPPVEDPDTLLLFLQHNKAPDRAPAGHSLVTLYTDGSATARYRTLTEAEISHWATGLVGRLFPELTGHHDFTHVSYWQQAGYLAEPGFWRRVDDLKARLPRSSRIQLAGDLFGAGSMESAVRSGERAAAALAYPKELQ